MSNVSSENLYIIEVTETLQKLVVVKADSKEEAIRNTKNKYNNGTLSLGDLDVVDSSIEIFNYNNPIEMDSLLEVYFEENQLNAEKIVKLLERCEEIKKINAKIRERN